jgi:HSP20 family protein
MRRTVLTRISSSSYSLWQPPVDIYESADELTAFMDAAGIAAGQIQVDVEPKMLTIKGERKCPAADILTVHQLEIEYGRFARQLPLPRAVDPRRVSSAFQQGFLVVRMPLLRIQNTVEVFVK